MYAGCMRVWLSIDMAYLAGLGVDIRNLRTGFLRRYEYSCGSWHIYRSRKDAAVGAVAISKLQVHFYLLRPLYNGEMPCVLHNGDIAKSLLMCVVRVSASLENAKAGQMSDI